MKKKIIGIIMALALFAASTPFGATPVAHAAQQTHTLLDAYDAYCDVLSRQVRDYGVNIDQSFDEWEAKMMRGEYAGQGVVYAEVIHLGDSLFPLLLYIIDSGYGPGRYVCNAYIYNYTDRLVSYSEHENSAGFFIGGDSPHGILRVAIDRSGLVYLHRKVLSWDLVEDDYGYIDEVDNSTETYYTIRNGQWTAVAASAVDIVSTRELDASMDAVYMTLVGLNNYVAPPSENNPSDWAVTEVNAALSQGLVPASIVDDGWLRSTTRQAAADAIVLLIEKALGKTMAQIAGERGWDLSANRFSDTISRTVTFLKYAGVTTGVGNNMYDPYGEYSRAQIVTMIGRAAETFFGIKAQGVNPFTDVPDWAEPYVGYAADNKITQGTGGGLFNSYGILQNQETAVFCYRTYNVWK